MKLFQLILLAGLSSIVFFSCKEVDDVPPVITLLGEDSVKSQVLNEPYDDMGATALDETDGDVTSKIWVDNPVDVDRISEYTLTYKAVDEAGNEASPVTRWVRVINLGYIYRGNYTAVENQVYPTPLTCESNIIVSLDSTINYRLIFDGIACEQGYDIYANVTDSIIEIPLQFMSDSLVNFSIQGSGIINTSRILIDYKKTEDTLTSFWEAEYTKLK